MLGEQLVVVVEVVAEERKRLDERPAAGHDLGAPAGQQIDRGEVLKDADRVVGRQDRDRARQPDALGAHGGRAQHDGGRRNEEVGPVVLAEPEDAEADLVSELCLLDQVAHALFRRNRRVQVRKGVDADFHEPLRRPSPLGGERRS